MPPQIALLLSLGLSVALLWREFRHYPEVSRATWIPWLWLMMFASRSASQWLNLSTPNSADALMEGSPFDRSVFTVLMAGAIVVLWRRRVPWARIVGNNPLLVAFFVYCALSVIWSDYPAVAAKRWFKSLGEPLMVLVLLSEAQPVRAVASVLRRCAYILVPLSIVFIKYYPDLGRDHDPWNGMLFYTGVTTNKNMLGYSLFVFGLLFVSTLLNRLPSSLSANPDVRGVRRIDVAIAVGFLLMIAYLFDMTDSKTPLLALCVATCVVIGLGLQTVRKHFGGFATAAVVVGVVLQLLFNVSDIAAASAGRDSTLTGRTEVWAVLLPMTPNVLLGAGFQSFWLGDRLNALWAMYPWHPNQAHNGYVEAYLNLGLLGLLAVAGLLVAAYRAARRRLAESHQLENEIFAKFALGFLVAFLFYNVTEAVLQPMNLLFLVFLLMTIRFPLAQQQQAVAQGVVGAAVVPISGRGKSLYFDRRNAPATSKIHRHADTGRRVFDRREHPTAMGTGIGANRARFSRLR